MGNPIQQRIKERIKACRQFLQSNIWALDTKSLSRLRTFIVRGVQVIILAARKSGQDKCLLHASALSYATLVAMIPVLAIAFAVSQSFGVQERFVKLFQVRLEDYPDQFAAAIGRIMDTIQNANYAAMSAVGVLLLFWVAVRVLTKIENTFNVIWGAPERRGILQRFTTYVSMVVIVPFLVIAATSIGTALSSDKLEGMISDIFGPLVFLYQVGVGLVAFAAVVLGFAMLYLFMPNVRVRLSAALSGGLLAGVLWYLVQWAYVASQVGVTRLNPVYGTFAAVPLFLAWIFISWVIVIIGSEFGYAVQQHENYAEEVLSREISYAGKEALAFLVMYDVCRVFCQGDNIWSSEMFTEKYGVSGRLVRDTLDMLSRAGLVVAVSETESEYVPVKAPGEITGADVIEAVQGRVGDDLYGLLEEASDKLYACFDGYKNVSVEHLSHADFRQLVQ